MEKSHPNDAGNIAFLVFAIIFCAPFVAVVLLLTARKAWNVLKPFFQDISETATKVVTMSKIKPEKAHNECDTSSSDSSKRNSISSHLIVPVEYSKSVFGNSISWLKARIAWSRLNTSQQQDAYNLEDQESCTTRASSNYSFRTTKKLLSYSKGLRGDASDQNSIETNSL
ncbi:hypothetical protein INT44_001502 [Umbelopsis vinacea]|uniref:Uncharacterized protein n=1 Tax=Umbelopsis vinacea TaxID=44442 RepID=A0A8H7PQG3_9FUNG|nr:hypothetical protein INT44_001502 [Umbelopsis vinacea]